MSGSVEHLSRTLLRQGVAREISQLWDKFIQQRQTWMDENSELQAYLTATDTTKTSNKSLPWRNSTTTPKLTQIADNLHANYMAALFPNEDWLKWEGFTLDDELKAKREAIEAYMKNKTRYSDFYTTISRCVHDYIEYGNAIADVEWVSEYKTDRVTGEQIPGYTGPKALRISPLDFVMNPIAASFEETSKLTRKLVGLGELEKYIQNRTDDGWQREALEESKKFRSQIAGGRYSQDDFARAQQYSIEGFGSLYEYYASPYVEIIEFEGDLYDLESGEFLQGYSIVVMDRTRLLKKAPMSSWIQKGTKAHVGWRLRSDNLYAMGPLHNLVGMQYRVDHLENLKADVFDIMAFPPLKITGDVEEFVWAPGAEIHLDEGGNVEILQTPLGILSVDNQIDVLMNRMEEFAGAPKQAMGIRTPGEKTAYEVQALESASGRIFKEKVENFSLFLERLLNSMLEVAVRNMDAADTIRVFEESLDQELFQTVTKEDITAKGILRPIGARHFFNQQQLVQNLTGLMNSPIKDLIAPHTSGLRLAKLMEDVFGMEQYRIFEENIALTEQAESQRVMNILQEQQVAEDSTQMTLDNQPEDEV